MGRKGLGEFETAVLLAIVHLHGRGYGVRIADEIERRSGRPVSFGAVYATLDRLQKKGLIKSELGDPTRREEGSRSGFIGSKLPVSVLCEKLRQWSSGCGPGCHRSGKRHEQAAFADYSFPSSRILVGRACCAESLYQHEF